MFGLYLAAFVVLLFAWFLSVVRVMRGTQVVSTQEDWDAYYNHLNAVLREKDRFMVVVEQRQDAKNQLRMNELAMGRYLHPATREWFEKVLVDTKI